jgi:hypothetical protein
MEISQNENDRPAKQANFLKVILYKIQRALTTINWFFTMTEVDRYQAGIDTNGEGRE